MSALRSHKNASWSIDRRYAAHAGGVGTRRFATAERSDRGVCAIVRQMLERIPKPGTESARFITTPARGPCRIHKDVLNTQSRHRLFRITKISGRSVPHSSNPLETQSPLTSLGKFIISNVRVKIGIAKYIDVPALTSDSGQEFQVECPLF